MNRIADECISPISHAAIVLALASSTLLCSAQEVIPDFYREPGLYPTRSYVNQSFNEHIDPFTGALQHHYVDLFLPGNGGFDLKVIRSYNSASINPTNPSAFESLAGLGWTIHFGRVLKTKETTICSNLNALSVADNPVLELPDGSRQLLAFTGVSSPLMLTTQRWRADCIFSGSGGLAVYSPDGTRYDMTQRVNVGTALNPVYAWYTTQITDRNGNTATITYAATASPEIAGVTASDGRAITFSYFDSGLLSRRIASISASGGQTFTYGYEAVPNVASKYFLKTVTRPGGTTWEYSYNGALGGSSLPGGLTPMPTPWPTPLLSTGGADPLADQPGSYVMYRVKYPEGGTIDYSFGWAYFDAQANPTYRSTVVTGKSVSTGGTWTFSYAPGGPGIYDTTTVNTPAGTMTYRHVGPNFSGSGTVWMVGLLMSKTTADQQIETYTWLGQKISNENYFRPGQFVTKVDVGTTNAPVLSQRVITRNGATYSTTYSGFDEHGNPGTLNESGPSGGSRTTTVSYFKNTSKWIIRQVKDETYSGASTTRSFDANNGNLLSVTRDGITTSYTYDGQGNPASATLPRFLTHTYSSYKRGIPQSELQPEGVNLSRTVSDSGNVVSETNGELRTTGYGYDGLNRVTSIAYPAGNAATISYGTVSKIATRGALVENTFYDGFGRPVSVTLGGITRTYAWDALGRMTFASNPGSSQGTSYQYDILNRLVRATNADQSFRTITYGAASMTATDERGRSTTNSYRAYGDPGRTFLMNVQASEASASISVQRNSPRDLVTSITQGGVSRYFDYYGNYYLKSTTSPETGFTSFGRDDAGNMTSRSVGSSGTTIYAYDGQNRLSSVTYPGSTPSVSKSYTRTHRLKTVVTSVASRQFDYDANDNLRAETINVDSYSFSIGYTYNGNDQLSVLVYPRSSSSVSFGPDALGRPTQASGYVSSISYWPSGQIAQMTYGNGTTTSHQQNARLWPSSFRVQTSSMVYANTAYGYDGAGNLTSIGDSVDSSLNRTLQYDGISRLTSATGPWGSGIITYSGAGNITSQTFGGVALNYIYDGTNRLSGVTGARSASYGYDAYGSVSTAGATTYTYDGAPNLRCVNCSNPSTKIEYVYDGLNQRVVTTKAGVKTYEIFAANGNLLAEYTPSQQNRLIEYIYLGGKRIAQKRTSDGVATTSTALTATPSPVVVSQTVTLTATVSGNNPTGLVVFKDGAITLGSAALSSGRATLTTSFPTVGIRSLTANYGGDNGNGTSTSTAVSLSVIAKTTTNSSLSVSPNPALIGQTVALRATVSGTNPTGQVSFSDGATSLGSAVLSAGLATLNTSFASAGSRSIVASYAGDGSNNGSVSAPVTLSVVAKVTTSTSLTASPNPALVSEAVALRATVSGVNPTGQVNFSDGATPLGGAVLSSGVATLNTSFASAGNRSITATYVGDGSNNGSVSSPVVQSVVTRVASSTVIDPLPDPTHSRACVAITARISGSSPTGTAKLFVPGKKTQPVVTVSALGIAQFPSNRYSAGTYEIRVEYAGDGRNSPSIGARTVTVLQSGGIGIDPPCESPSTPPVSAATLLTR